jgi:hypothetical protein
MKTLRQAFNEALLNPDNYYSKPCGADVEGKPNWNFVHADIDAPPGVYTTQGFDNLVFEWKRINKRFN